MSGAKVFPFAIPDRSSQSAALADMRAYLIEVGEPLACIDFVLNTIGLIIQANGLSQGTEIPPMPEHEFSTSIKSIREVEKRLIATSSSLIGELVIAYTQIWHLEHGS